MDSSEHPVCLAPKPPLSVSSHHTLSASGFKSLAPSLLSMASGR